MNRLSYRSLLALAVLVLSASTAQARHPFQVEDQTGAANGPVAPR